MAKTSLNQVNVGVSLKKAWIGVIIFYAVALALNGVQLNRNNEQLEYGNVRDFWLKVSAPIAKICEAAHLNAPREWLESTLGAKLNK